MQKVDDTLVTVKLDALARKVKVHPGCLGPQRVAESGMQWQVGDPVHVLETNEGVDGWWEAAILRQKKNGWKILWHGQYEDHDDEGFVNGAHLRRAHVP